MKQSKVFILIIMIVCRKMSLFVVIISTHHIDVHTHHSTLGREFSKQLRHVVGEGLELQPVIITSTNEGKMDRERTKKQEMDRYMYM